MPLKHLPDQLSDFLQYLASDSKDDDRIPPLTDLSKQLKVSVASLREQLEVARALGWVEVRPRTGIRRLPFSFRPAVEQGLAYAIAVDPKYFNAYSEFRHHIEASFFLEAVVLLGDCEKQELKALIQRAKEKLRRNPIQIPHQEHRELHLLTFRKLDNPFVIGVLEAYWDLYEAVGLDVYTDLDYLNRVWEYHEKMVEAICDGNFNTGYQLLLDHMALLDQRSKSIQKQLFE